MLRIGWFSTGRGEGSRGLLQFIQEAISRGDLNARIEFVFSNREPGEADGSDQFFELVRSYRLPLVTLSSGRYRREHGGGSMARHRLGFDQKVIRLLEPYEPDICALAGYMLVCSGDMCRRYPLLNLHGALPDGPTGTWQSVIWQLIDARSTRTGAMIHLATEEVDRGPVLSHCVVPIAGNGFEQHWGALRDRDAKDIRANEGEDYPLFQRIRAAGYLREPYLLLETLRAVSDGRLRVQPEMALDASGNPLGSKHPAGLPFTDRIEAALSAG